MPKKVLISSLLIVFSLGLGFIVYYNLATIRNKNVRDSIDKNLELAYKYDQSFNQVITDLIGIYEQDSGYSTNTLTSEVTEIVTKIENVNLQLDNYKSKFEQVRIDTDRGPTEDTKEFKNEVDEIVALKIDTLDKISNFHIELLCSLENLAPLADLPNYSEIEFDQLSEEDIGNIQSIYSTIVINIEEITNCFEGYITDEERINILKIKESIQAFQELFTQFIAADRAENTENLVFIAQQIEDVGITDPSLFDPINQVFVEVIKKKNLDFLESARQVTNRQEQLQSTAEEIKSEHERVFNF